MSGVKELPTTFQFWKENEDQESHLNFLWLAILPRIDDEFSSTRDDEVGYDCWDRYRWRFFRGRDVLNERMNGKGECGPRLGKW